MEIGHFRIITSKIRSFTDQIMLHVLGEPLLHPDLETILDIADENKLLVNITSNGVLLKNMVGLLQKKKSLRQINISLHSKGGYTNEKDASEYIDEMIGVSRDIINSSGIIVSMRLWNISDGDQEADHYNIRVAQMLEKAFRKKILLQTIGYTRMGMKLKDQLYLNFDNRFAWPRLEGTISEHQGFCYGLRHHVAVLTDGTVVPCCLDNKGDIPLGNLLTENMDDILSAIRSRNIISGFSERRAVEPLCIRCTYKNRFNNNKSQMRSIPKIASSIKGPPGYRVV